MLVRCAGRRSSTRSRWSVGQRVSAPLRWCDAPELPDDLTVHDVAAQAQLLYGPDRRPIGQLVTMAGITAGQTGRTDAVLIRLSGCCYVDRRFHPVGGRLPPTVGIERQVRVVLHLHDRGADRWIRRPGATRTVNVPDTSSVWLRDDPDLTRRRPDGQYLSRSLWTSSARPSTSSGRHSGGQKPPPTAGVPVAGPWFPRLP